MAARAGKMAVNGIHLYTRVEGHPGDAGPKPGRGVPCSAWRDSPIVLMHGGPGADHVTLSPLRRLASTNTLVFYDHRCNGRSVGMDVTSMTWDNLTADADALRQALGFERWAVFGHSWGGMVALEYAFRYPQRISHLILADTCADICWAQQRAPAELARRGFPPDVVEDARRFFSGRIAPNEMMACLFKFGRAYSETFNLWQMLEGLGTQMRPEALIYGFGTLLKGWNVMDKLPTLSMPVLLMAGRRDFQFPPECQQAMAARIPNARLEIVERAGHNAPMEHPRLAAQLIRGFVSGSEAAA